MEKTPEMCLSTSEVLKYDRLMVHLEAGSSDKLSFRRQLYCPTWAAQDRCSRCSTAGLVMCTPTSCCSVHTASCWADGLTLVYWYHKHLVPSRDRKYDFCLCIWMTFEFLMWQMDEVEKSENVLDDSPSRLHLYIYIYMYLYTYKSFAL